MTIAITGIGVITPWGADASTSAAAWQAGRALPTVLVPELAGTSWADLRVAPACLPIAGPPGFRRMAKYLSASGRLAVPAAHAALVEAGLICPPERLALVAAAGAAAIDWDEIAPMVQAACGPDGVFSLERLGREGFDHCDPLLAFRILPNLAACLVSILEGIRGPSLIFAAGPAAGGDALAAAMELLEDGDADAVLVGAAEDRTHPMAVLAAASAVDVGDIRRDRGRPRPLPSKVVPSLAAAFLVLEPLTRAQARSAPIRALLHRAEVLCTDHPRHDPLAITLGDTGVAAAPLRIALTANLGQRIDDAALVDADGRSVYLHLEPWP